MRTKPALAACGSAFLFIAVGTVAHAGAAVLPASGTAFSVVEDGDMVMECDGDVHRIEMHGAGRLRVGDRVAGDSPTVLVSTEAEQLTGYDPDLGTVTVTQKEPVSGELVAPTATLAYPAAESFAQDVTVAMDHSPCRGGQPAVYTSKSPFSLLNTGLRSFPPRNTVYQLLEPVELADVSDPSAAPFTLTGFPVTVTRSF